MATNFPNDSSNDDLGNSSRPSTSIDDFSMGNELLDDLCNEVVQRRSKRTISNESADQRKKRLQNDREKKRTKRVAEDYIPIPRNTQNRHEAERYEAERYVERIVELRDNETIQANIERREQDAEREAERRRNEDVGERQERLEGRRQARVGRLNNVQSYRIACRPLAEEAGILLYSCGEMDVECQFCHALHYTQEKPPDGKFSMCCQKGRVMLPLPGHDFPTLLRRLFDGSHERSHNFMTNIRSFNSALSFASLGCSQVRHVGGGPYVFSLQGGIYHQTFPLHPNTGFKPLYSQLYVLDAAEAHEERMGGSASAPTRNEKCDQVVMVALDALLREINPFARNYKNMREMLREQEKEGPPRQVVTMTIQAKPLVVGAHPGRYNAPTVNEVAFVFRSQDGAPAPNKERDVAVYLRIPDRGAPFLRIDPETPICDPMTYALFFPRGEAGWNIQMQSVNPMTRVLNPGTRVTMREFYSFMMSSFKDHFNPILKGGKLFQQYIVDGYMKAESNNLEYIRQNQASLRSEKYSGLMDYLHNAAEHDGARVGRVVILPSTFIGSPRAMKQKYQDAMAIMTKFGKPDLFITITCNPKWQEITSQLLPGQSAVDRPDVTARVFHIKLQEMMKDILKGQIFGKSIAHFGTIEFQKRGLPHAHLLFILQRHDMIETGDQIDACITAELPDKEKNPRLHALVMQTMIHGPCGSDRPTSPCMEAGKCTKGYPFDFYRVTIPNLGGRPRYRRREDSPREKVGQKWVDSRDVVPYNPYLTLKYGCHINVEACCSVSSVKYACKYVTKGLDAATIKITKRADTEGGGEVYDWDEVDSYMDARYLSPPEAVWRLLGFPMSFASHTIIRLAVHLENEQIVCFPEGQEQAAAERAAERDTTLTAWFKLNQQDPAARRFLYREIPEHYVFQSKERKWTKRQQRQGQIIGRVYSVSPLDKERFYLRLLLSNIHGATSFNFLRTHNNVTYPTFRQAAIARNLLSDDGVWKKTLEEASSFQMPCELRQLFVLICVYGNPKDANELLQQFKDQMMEDFVRRGHCVELSQALLYREVHDLFRRYGMHSSDFELPPPDSDVLREHEQLLLREEREVADAHQQDRVSEAISRGREMVGQLNEDQANAFHAVMMAVDDPAYPQRLFFLDGPGGTGKTFVYNALANVLTGRGEKVFCVASTGIAAALLPDGVTSYSLFKLTPPITETSTSAITETSFEAAQLRKASLFIYDESTMTPKDLLNAIDRLLRMIMRRPDLPFGGKVMLLGGDFRQCLPVVVGGHRSEIIENTIKRSNSWHHFKQLHLTQNMRMSNDPEFAKWLLQLGNGEISNEDGLDKEFFKVPEDLLLASSGLSLTTAVFGENFENIMDNPQFFAERAILSPKNDDCNVLNNMIVERLPGELQTYFSADSIESDDPEEVGNFPVEYLNTLQPSGIPPHQLNLKKGAIMLCLRNLNTREGLCNGTRLMVRGLTDNLIVAEGLAGKAERRIYFIPRIDCKISDSNLPFKLIRRQFPVLLAFAMTINKSQGQTLKQVGINLPEPVFGHGQNYVAFTRATSRNGVRVLVHNTSRHGKLLAATPDSVYTRNVVFKEIFET